MTDHTGLSRRALIAGGSAALGLAACAVQPPRWTRHGIDVSADNGPVAWDAVRTGGVGFAYLRATDGQGGQDRAYAGNTAGARQAKVVQGAYHVFSTRRSGAAQAQHFLSVADLRDGDLPPMLDLEGAGPESSTPGAVVREIEAWLTTVQQALRLRLGRAALPGVYLRTNIWTALGRPDWSTYPLWIAQWDTSAPDVPPIWPGYAFWQHSDEGRVPGVSGPVDLSRGSGLAARYRL